MPELTYEYDGAPPAAASGNGTHPRDVIEFPPNLPVQMCLQYPKPKMITTKRGIRYMVTTKKGIAFLGADPIVKMDHLQLKPGELFWICFRKNGQEDPLGEWDVYLDPATERARGVVAPEPKALTSATSTKPLARDACSPSRDRTKDTLSATFAQRLVGTTDALIDSYAACLAYAERHGDKVRKDDVLALLLAAFNRGGTNG